MPHTLQRLLSSCQRPCPTIFLLFAFTAIPLIHMMKHSEIKKARMAFSQRG